MTNILEELTNASLRFLTPLNPERTYEIIVDEAVRLVNAEYGSIVLYQNGELNRIYSSSKKAFLTNNRKKGNTYRAFINKKVIIADISKTSPSHPELRDLGIVSSVFIPLSYQDKAIGVLTINSRKKINNTAEELKILKLFGAMASLSIRKTQLYDETKRALEIRDHFIALASHELRTPLTSINGYIQLLYSKRETLSKTAGNWVNELYAESGRLTNLVKELLEINRIKQGQLSFVLHECDIKQIVTNAVERFRMMYPDRSIIFESKLKNGNTTVIGDFDKLLQTFSGILNNAQKFSFPSSNISILLTEQKKFFIVTIRDKGVGIAEREIPKIFEGFHKAEDNFHEGMGVGLLLAKHIITYHKGSITVDSKEKKGTVVQIKLPQAMQYERV